MTSAVISTSAALRRPFVFDADFEPEVGLLPGKKLPSSDSKITQVVQSTIKNQQSAIAVSFGNRTSAIENSILPASRLEIRPSPEMVTTGIPALDALIGGLPRGCLTEIYGPASSGRTTVLLAALAAATRRGEFCALIDAGDALDPQFAAAAGVDLDHLLWVRCCEDLQVKNHSSQRQRDTEKNSNQEKGRPAPMEQVGPFSEAAFEFDPTGPKRNTARLRRLEQVLRATDLLLESGGFGLIILDLADCPPQDARRIPMTTWFRFRRAVEDKPTILLAIEQQPIAGSCSSLLLQLQVPSSQFAVLSSNRNHLSDAEHDIAQDVRLAHAQLFTGLEISLELVRSRLDRKPARSVTFETKTAWAR